MPLTPASNSNLITAAGTHPGETGKNNEDSYALLFFRTENDDPVTLAVVADGVGGNRAGEVASALAVRAVAERVAESEGDDYRAIFNSSVQAATAVIVEHTKIDQDYIGMSTTCAIALVVGRRLHIAYVGDSRLYLMRHGHIRQISVDHTWLQAALDHKLIEPRNADKHPNKHVLLRYIGAKVNARPDLRLVLAQGETLEQSESNQGFQLAPGDTVLLCTDGLSDLVKEDEIGVALREYEPQKAVDELISLARRRGGHDNITAIVLKVPPA